MLRCYDKLVVAYPDAKVIVTGHSLGAAVSHFMVADLYAFREKTVDYYINF